MKILVTGASGFIGSFAVERAIELGHEVWAAVRPSSSRQWLRHPAIHFIVLSLNNYNDLVAQLTAFGNEGGHWDYVVHAAGVTKAVHDDDFLRGNRDTTRHLLRALKETDLVPCRFVLLSSLSVLGAIREARLPSQGDGPHYAALTALDEPQPNTAYGRSKLATERAVREQGDIPYIIIRPTGVYGPRERDYYLMAKSIGRHVDFAVGRRPQEITFIYVRDLVDAIFLLLERGQQGGVYLLSDGQTYSSRAFSDLLQKEMGVKRVLHVRAPLWLLRMVCVISDLVGRLSGHMSALNVDKYHILRQRNWRCDIRPACEAGFEPRYGLDEGVRETVAWYKAEGWL